MAPALSGSISRTLWSSPIGALGLASRDGDLLAVRLRAVPHRFEEGLEASYGNAGSEHPGPFAEAIRQLGEYFEGTRTSFDLPIDLDQGTPFQRRVWRALLEIPYGQTVSYAAIARTIGEPGAARAVGAANGANPLPIVVPCHRVAASGGKLGGFSGGLDLKRRLLDLETGVVLRRSRFGLLEE